MWRETLFCEIKNGKFISNEIFFQFLSGHTVEPLKKKKENKLLDCCVISSLAGIFGLANLVDVRVVSFTSRRVKLSEEVNDVYVDSNMPDGLIRIKFG